MAEHRSYLGDSVYVEIETGMVKLTTNNGYADDPRNVIYMDNTVLMAFEAWLERLPTTRTPRTEEQSDG